MRYVRRMRVLLLVIGALGIGAAALGYVASKGAIHEVTVALMFLIGVVGLAGAAITGAVEDIGEQIRAELKAEQIRRTPAAFKQQ